jgi:hypothetical protein
MTKLKTAPTLAPLVGMRLALLLAVAVAASGCTFFSTVHDKTGSVGSSAKELASGAKYPKLHVEIDFPTGSEPNDQALGDWQLAIADATGRSASNVILTKNAVIPSEPGRKYSTSDIVSLEDAHRTVHTSGDTAGLFILYVAGGSDADSSDGSALVLGAAYRATSIVMFKGNIKSSSSADCSGLLCTPTSKPQEHYVERAVLIHEMGHAMGLVDLGAPMQRPHEDTSGAPGHDPARHGHSSNQNDVMWWAVENSASLSSLVSCGTGDCGSTIPYQYDGDDKADLAALRSS